MTQSGYNSLPHSFLGTTTSVEEGEWTILAAEADNLMDQEDVFRLPKPHPRRQAVQDPGSIHSRVHSQIKAQDMLILKQWFHLINSCKRGL